MFGNFGSGSDNIQLAAINPLNAFKNLQGSTIGGDTIASEPGREIGVFFAFWSWVGFEMAPDSGEESKNPKKIVPRAMYISVIGLGIYCVVASWASLSASRPPKPPRLSLVGRRGVLPRPRRGLQRSRAP